MEKLVTVKTKYPHYDGYVRGFKFTEGTAEVPLADAEAMKEFGIEIVKPEAPEPVVKAPVKPKKAKAKVGE